MQVLDLEALVQMCAGETRSARGRSEGACFEIFRRAFDEKQPDAWKAVEAQYLPLLMRWAKARGDIGEDAESVAREGLEKAWRVLSRSGFPLASRFPHMGAVLRYLQQCVMSVSLDRQRRQQRWQAAELELQVLRDEYEVPPPSTLERMCRAEEVARVRAWVSSQVTDPLELQILKLAFEDELTPAEIVRQFPQEFPDAATVNRIKERVLKRARRGLDKNEP